MHARLDGGRVQILTRRGNDWTDKYPVIAKSIAGLPARNAYLDGELCGEANLMSAILDPGKADSIADQEQSKGVAARSAASPLRSLSPQRIVAN
jgi:ATP-dependent DNA ligase